MHKDIIHHKNKFELISIRQANKMVKITIIIFSPNFPVYSELMPALQYTLEWFYQFVVFQNETHVLFRQCASALIALLAATNSIHGFSEKLSLCFSKWFSMATQYGNLEVSPLNNLNDDYHFSLENATYPTIISFYSSE